MAATNSSDSELFSGGIEMANLMLCTGILQKGWDSILELQQTSQLSFSIKKLPKYTIVAFNSTRHQQDFQPTLVSVNQESPLSFLITKDNKSISLHSSPLSTFGSLLDNDLKNQIQPLTYKNQPQLILVGQSLGGSVAALVTLWLLKNRLSTSLPICITYGSPFIGDQGLQKAIGKIEQWKAQFWHVVGHDDLVPRLFVVSKLKTQLVPSAGGEFKPFGTYFLCSGSSCTCIDHPDSVLELLDHSTPILGGLNLTQLPLKDYGATLKQLKENIKYRNNTQTTGNSSLKVGLALQLEAVGIGSNHPKHVEMLDKMEKKEPEVYCRRKSVPNPSKRLNEVKQQMAKLEWYMKKSEEKNMEYYDCFKFRSSEKDIDVIKIKNILTKYWKEEVEKAENNPQTPDVPLRDRWLFGGTNYRRMVEPLDIAEYYRKPGNRDYVTNGRAHHYQVLEKWYEDTDKKKKEKKAPILTEDSCFWAHVEEAKLNLKELNSGGKEGVDELRVKLIQFEEYVKNSVEKYELSPTVFQENSGFMAWWKDYEKNVEHGHNSQFIRFMKRSEYLKYMKNQPISFA